MPKPPFTGLDKLLQTVAFSDSVMESVDSKLLPNGRLSSVSDAVFDKIGNIKKRKGYEVLSNSALSALFYGAPPSMGTLARGWGHGDELCVFDERFVWARTALSNWALKTAHGAPSISRVGFYQDVGSAISDLDIAVAPNGMLCAGYVIQTDASEDFLYSSILDLSTEGTVFLHKPANTSIDTWANPRMLVVGTTFVLIARDTTGTDAVKAMRLSSTAPAAAWTTAATLLDSDAAFDAVSMGDTLYAVAAYDGTDLVLSTFNLSDVQVNTFTVDTGVGASPHGVALDWDGTFIHIAWYDGNGNVQYAKYSSTLAFQGEVNVQGSVSFTGSGDARIGVRHYNTVAFVTWQETAASGVTALDTVLLRWNGVNTSTYATVGSTQHIAHHFLVARPFVQDGEFHALTSGDGYYQSLPAHPFEAFAEGLFLLRWDPALLSVDGSSGRLVAQAGLGDAFGMNTSQALRQVAEYGGDFFTAQKLANRYFSTVDTAKYDFDIFRVEPRRSERAMAIHSPSETILSGGVPSIYDGELVTELSFPYAPLIVRTDELASGGLEMDGVYFWKVVFEWKDRSGNVVWSETSLEVSATASADGKGRQIFYRGMPISNKGDWFPSPYVNVDAVIYRTLKNDDQVYYRVGRQPLNRYATDYYGFDDATSDDDIRANEEIYTSGGELDAQGMPSCSIGAVVDQRAWLVSDEDPRKLFYSKAWIPKRVAEFNWEFANKILPMKCTAVAAGLGYLVAFGADQIVFVEGRGPGSTGQNDDFVVRQVVGGDGTTQPMSVADTPVGIFFHNGRTFKVLAGTRLEEAGEDVEVTLRGYPTVIANTVSVEENTVRFLCLAPIPQSGARRYVIATFNWLRKAWSFHYPTLIEDTTGRKQAVDLVRVAGENYALAGTRAFKETGYADYRVNTPVLGDPTVVPAFFPMVLETADIKVENLSEFRRIWRLITVFTRVGVHGLHIDVSYDKGRSWRLLKELSTTQITAVGPLERLRIHLVKQKCASVRFRFYDTAPTDLSGTAGFEAHGFTLEFGMKRGILKVPQFQTG